MQKTKKEESNWEIVKANTNWLFGNKTPQLQPHEVIALVRMKNAAVYLPSFIKHYFELGVAHIVFLDNHSTDNSVALATQHQQVTVLQTKLPYKKFKMAFIHYLLREFGQQNWSLVVDADEFFDYPFSNILPLENLIQYLDQYGYRAMVGQMLDLFPAKLAGNDTALSNPNFIKDHVFYDLSDISKHLLHKVVNRNRWSNYNIKIHRGGIRKKWFGLANIVLSKFALVRFAPDWEWPSIHHLYHTKIADCSGVLYHYKFMDNFLVLVKDAVKEEQYNKNSDAYKKILTVIQQKGWPTFDPQKVQQKPNPFKLVKQNFLVTSTNYLKFIYTQLNEQLFQGAITPETLIKQQKQLLDISFSKAENIEEALMEAKKRLQAEKIQEVQKIKSSWSWKIGNAIVTPLKSWTKWLKK